MSRIKNVAYLLLGYNCFFSKMCRDYINELKELGREHVHIKNKNTVNKLIDEIVKGGAIKLQIVSDFDKTITKQYENDKEYHSSFALFSKCPSVPQSYLKKEEEIRNKYQPIELNPNIAIKDKISDMEKWWLLSEQELKGLKVSREEIDKVISEIGPSLRNGSDEFFDKLYKNNIPILVFSAGLGDTVESVLKHFNVFYSNVKVISNFIKYDEQGVIQGYVYDIIHVFNKNEFALKNTKYYNIIKDRNNVILMGDSLGDAGMADGIENANAILKIGFLYEHREENLPKYMEMFDIVLVDDQTMNVINAILKLIS